MSHALLLLEGGDERSLCERLIPPLRWPEFRCWYGSGRSNLAMLAGLAAKAPNVGHARSISVVLDVEDDPAAAAQIAADCFLAFEAGVQPQHAALAGTKRLGVFYLPGGLSQPGSLETLCKSAVRDATAATCVDSLQTCIGGGARHTTQARRDKCWLEAYLATMANPGTKFHGSFEEPDGIDPAHAVFDPLRNFLAAL